MYENNDFYNWTIRKRLYNRRKEALTRRVDEEIVATRVKTSIPANYTKASRSYIYLYNGRMHV